MRLGGPQGQSGRLEKRKITFPYRDSNSITFSVQPGNYIDCASQLIIIIIIITIIIIIIRGLG